MLLPAVYIRLFLISSPIILEDILWSELGETKVKYCYFIIYEESFLTRTLHFCCVLTVSKQLQRLIYVLLSMSSFEGFVYFIKTL